MLNFAPTGMHRFFSAGGAEFFMLQLSGGFLVNPGGIVLHFAFFADQIYVGALSSWHKFKVIGSVEPSPGIEPGTSSLPWMRSTD